MDRTIEPMAGYNKFDEYGVYEHGVYGNSSVLAGQPKRTFIEGGTLEELQEQYPDAQVLDHSTRVDPVLPDVAPDWFDPMDAGEEW